MQMLNVMKNNYPLFSKDMLRSGKLLSL